MSIIRFGWERFNLIASIIGDVQGRVIAVTFYFTILMPFGIGSRLFSDPLRLKAYSGESSSWLERPAVPNDIDSAKEQG